MLIALLGALFALGTASSAVQAGGMAAKMATMSDLGMPGDGHCAACDARDGDGFAAAAPCAPICAPSAMAVLPPAATARTVKSISLAPPTVPPLRNAAFAPEPDPPRSADLC